MVNRIPSETVELVRSLVRQGFSVRKIAALAGVDRNTAHTYSQKFRDEMPECHHGKRLSACGSCISGRHGWRTPDGKKRNIGGRAKMAAELVCLAALKELRRG